VASPSELTGNPQLRDRGFFLQIDTDSGQVVDAGFPFASPGLPRPVRLREPQYVEADATWAGTTSATLGLLRGWPARTSVHVEARSARSGSSRQACEPSAETTSTARRDSALDGVRVLDLTWVLAGPYVTKILGEHGADIVKVESAHRQDPTRFSPSMRLRPGASPDESGYFLNFNCNKRSLTPNLRTEEGRDLLRRLVSVVDVVVENFSPGVLDRWGLGYERMREQNPDVILVSMAGAGQTGPWRRAVTFADTLAAMSGLTHETARHGQPPQGLAVPYPIPDSSSRLVA